MLNHKVVKCENNKQCKNRYTLPEYTHFLVTLLGREVFHFSKVSSTIMRSFLGANAMFIYAYFLVEIINCLQRCNYSTIFHKFSYFFDNYIIYTIPKHYIYVYNFLWDNHNCMRETKRFWETPNVPTYNPHHTKMFFLLF